MSNRSDRTGALGLHGKVVVVAGASSGIGLAVAARCVDDGADVVMLARRGDRLAQAAEAIGEAAMPLVCDVSRADAVAGAFAAIEARHGRIDALLNIAGVARTRRIDECSDDDIAFVLGVNLLGTIHTCRAAIPLLRRAGGGDIINVSSEITRDHLPHMVLYATSKGGVEVFTSQLGHELRPDHIRVTLLVAGSTAGTAFGENFSPDDLARAYPDWVESGYLTRVAGPGMDPAWMADAFAYVLTRPRGQVIDVLHVRSFGAGSAERSDERE